MLRRDAVLDGLPATVGKPDGRSLPDAGSENTFRRDAPCCVLTVNLGSRIRSVKRRTTKKETAETGFTRPNNEIEPDSTKAPSPRKPFIGAPSWSAWHDSR